MKLLVFKALWGMGGSLEDQIRRIAEAGYDGIETGVPGVERADAFQRLLHEYRLAYVAMAFTDGDTPQAHLRSLQVQVEAAKTFEPLSLTVHSGQDRWAEAEQRAYFEGAMEVERKGCVPLNHETHRGRILFTPWTTAARLREYPGLFLAADFSHFVCVCESDLKRDAADLEVCIERARHVHGRVGFEEGPQVSDPRAPEWQGFVERHMGWWEAIAKARKRAGAEVFTFTPEFGPPNYQTVLPYTRQPVADLWDICLYMGHSLRRHYAEWGV